MDWLCFVCHLPAMWRTRGPFVRHLCTQHAGQADREGYCVVAIP